MIQTNIELAMYYLKQAQGLLAGAAQSQNVSMQDPGNQTMLQGQAIRQADMAVRALQASIQFSSKAIEELGGKVEERNVDY